MKLYNNKNNESNILHIIDCLLILLERIYSFGNSKFLIIEHHQKLDTYITTNVLSDIVKYLGIEGEFYSHIIKNYVGNHLKKYSYYSTFSLVLLLKTLKLGFSLKQKWGNKNIIRYFCKLGQEILKILKSLRKTIKEDEINLESITSYISLSNLSFFNNEKNSLKEFILFFISSFKDSEKCIKIFPFSRYDSLLNLNTYEKGYSFNIDKNITNIKLLTQFYDEQIKKKNSFLIKNTNFLLLESESLNFEDEILKYYNNLQDFIFDLSYAKIKVIMTNSILTNSLEFSFYGENVIVLGNMKKKKMHFISKILNRNAIFFVHFKEKEFIQQVMPMDIEIILINNPLYSEKLTFFLRNNHSELKIFSIFLQFLSEPNFHQKKHLIKTSIQKLQNLLKFRKCLPGCGSTEIKIAEALRKLINEKYKDDFVYQDLKNDLSNLFEEIVDQLYANEGYFIDEINQQKKIFYNKDMPILFYDDYKAKKFCIENSFYYFNLVMNINFR